MALKKTNIIILYHFLVIYIFIIYSMKIKEGKEI